MCMCLKLTFISKVACVVKSAYVRADVTTAAPCQDNKPKHFEAWK